ncbi:MAG: hypothetical protein NC336_08795 [Clostridium sp.]|nr:hypothetical protein [Clostridium sp.]
MKVKSILKMMAAVALCFGASACSDDKPDIPENGGQVKLPRQRMFVLNQGIWNANNATLAFIDPDDPTKSIGDIYLAQNGTNLGDTGQQVIEYDGAMYIAMSTSNYLVRTNSAAVIESSISFVDDPDLQAGIRYIAADDKHIFATFYGGWLLKIRCSDLTVVKKVKTEAANLEGVAVADGNVYVSDAYEMVFGAGANSGYHYHDQVLVYKTSDLSKVGAVTVGVNPNKIVEEDDRLFVMCLGNYADKGYTAYMIDTGNNNAVSYIGDATEVAVDNGKAYFVNSVTDWLTMTTTNSFFSYDIKSGKTSSSSFLSGAPDELSSATISMISVNPETHEFYIGVSFYASSDGDIYRFDRSGRYVSKFSSKGQHPVDAVYFD